LASDRIAVLVAQLRLARLAQDPAVSARLANRVPTALTAASKGPFEVMKLTQP
jgi:hypothetical protein